MATYLNQRTNQVFESDKEMSCVPDHCTCLPETCGGCAWKGEAKLDKSAKVTGLYWCMNDEVRVYSVWDKRKSCPKGVVELRKMQEIPEDIQNIFPPFELEGEERKRKPQSKKKSEKRSKTYLGWGNERMVE